MHSIVIILKIYFILFYSRINTLAREKYLVLFLLSKSKMLNFDCIMRFQGRIYNNCFLFLLFLYFKLLYFILG